MDVNLQQEVAKKRTKILKLVMAWLPKTTNLGKSNAMKRNSPAKNAGSAQPHCLDADSFLLVLRWDIGRKTP